jgi:ubiquinone/menaquinone biosynthesis C-methylase UbiE
MDSNFEKDYFDRIFALESACYSPNKNVFLKEMNRILKNKGELLIIDTFPKNRVINSLTVNVYNYLRDLKCSENDIKNFYVEIDRFRNYLELNKFREISTRDLVSLGNVKKSHIYAFLVFRIFPNIKSKIKKNWKRSLRFTLFVPFLIIIFFVYELLLIFYERPSYYCVKAKK